MYAIQQECFSERCVAMQVWLSSQLQHHIHRAIAQMPAMPVSQTCYRLVTWILCLPNAALDNPKSHARCPKLSLKSRPFYTNITSHPASPMIAFSTDLSNPPLDPCAPPRLVAPSFALLFPPPIPLQMKSPASRPRVELAVVLALLLAGRTGMLLVAPLTMSAVPCGSRLYVVPLIVIAWPGRSVIPGARTNSVVPSRVVAVYVLPLMVSSGAAVRGLLPKVEVTPLMTMTLFAGMLYVVPETVTTPPGVRVWPGPKIKAVVPSKTTGLMPGESVEVAPLAMTTTPPPVAGRLYVVPEMVRADPGASVLSPRTTCVVPPITVAETTRPPTVITGGEVMIGALAMVCVTPLIMAIVPPGPRLSVLPSAVIAGPPGRRVCDPTTN